ncbi:two pore channel protein 2 isoform X1 [Pocillopora verrucosa]|uniref:two pore channel protein 2 isoform X1 n=1 Tax=Pocillopora verrucosa TaxID=203993 RepID=UPI00334126CB
MEQMEVQNIQRFLINDDDISGHAINQAAVFVEDAAQYRSINHKVDSKSLWMYRWYYSKPVRWGYTFIIFLYLMLAFVEKPSSLTLSSDPRFRGKRPNPPCGVTESFEIIFLLCFVFDLVVKGHVLGRQEVIKNRWLLSYCGVLIISFIDVFISLSSGCKLRVRIHRLFRPFFLIQNSSLMKKLLHAIKRTVPEILSVLFLLLLHLWFFAMCGMLLFPQASRHNSTLASYPCSDHNNDSASGAACEGSEFFPKLEISLRSLLVLLTTANNPDVMMPAYMKNRFYAIFFITFTIIGLYFFLNMLTAVIYNQFRGYLTSSLQASFFRRRVGIRAAFEVLLKIQDQDSDVPLGHVSTADAKTVIEKANIGRRASQVVLLRLAKNTTGHLNAKQFQDLFDALDQVTRRRIRPPMSYVENPLLRKIQIIVSSRCFDYAGDLMSGVNVLLVSILLDFEYDKTWKTNNSHLSIVNFFFVLYYTIEQIVKLWAIGWQRYRSSLVDIYCGVVTLLLVALEIVHVSIFGPPFSSSSSSQPLHNLESIFSLANMIRVINMLIIFRLLRIVPSIKSLSLIVETLIKLLKHLRPFGGIIVASYYVFAILGMMLFEGVTSPSVVGAEKTRILSQKCGSFDQLQYYANNFDDFGAALVVLWDLMVVNNWHVFLKEYAAVVSSWSQLYFVAWYLISVILIINLFIALILEAFISQWETKQQRMRQNDGMRTLETEATSHVGNRFHQLFSADLVEPTEEDLVIELSGHHHYRFNVQGSGEMSCGRPFQSL